MMRFVVGGKLACFSRPECPDRFSYPFIPPSAARGIIEAIYTHPGLYADVRRISLLAPIRYIRLGHTHSPGIPKLSQGVMKAPVGDRRTTLECLLRHPKWMIEFDWRALPFTSIKTPWQRRDRSGSMGPKATHMQRVDFAKAVAIFMRRIERGEFYYTPTLGLHDFRAVFRPATPADVPIKQTREFGQVVHDFDYRAQPPIPHVFEANMQNGVIEVPSFYDTVLQHVESKVA